MPALQTQSHEFKPQCHKKRKEEGRKRGRGEREGKKEGKEKRKIEMKRKGWVWDILGCGAGKIF
jgi:hypothetical protein